MASSEQQTPVVERDAAFYTGPSRSPWLNPKARMLSSLRSLAGKLTPPSSEVPGFAKARSPTQLFQKPDPRVDGEECLRDCETCTVKYPRTFKIDEEEDLYGHVKGWSRHVICATGKTDWVRDVSDEKGSIMEALGKHNGLHEGKLMLSASDMPVAETPEAPDSTSVILLPAFSIVDGVTPSTVPDLITHIINHSPTNTSPLATSSSQNAAIAGTNGEPNGTSSLPKELKFKVRPCPHNYLILLCSQKTRDARCGQSAPLLRKEFERHLRPLGLYRDLHDERPGGVGIYFISHVGGHKFSANVMIYRRASAPHLDGAACEIEAEEHKVDQLLSHPDGKDAQEVGLGAAQCIWIARVRPEDCENIVRYTVLQGKVLKPEYQLRGGFDREKQLMSW